MRLIPVAITLILTLGALAWHRQQLHNGYNQQLAILATNLKPGTPQKHIDAQLEQLKHPITIERTPTQYRIAAPPQWGAQNHILTLDLSPDQKLTHRRLRTADSETHPPSNAPPDF